MLYYLVIVQAQEQLQTMTKNLFDPSVVLKHCV
ncbi:hypothetical protein Pse7429DRAFT_3949 [Pseudanabaena biceps PCC 7429]|uniref:Uncharacterized protein n=1 Tax=Pseudanabaena biceps PCC 7429 TaxID=927668 RepID=L8MX01_9CYAN|nr:hypothetical protein Pse7429DRAFT_3949 [Pseudanabaena biceps PCC 7429]